MACARKWKDFLLISSRLTKNIHVHVKQGFQTEIERRTEDTTRLTDSPKHR